MKTILISLGIIILVVLGVFAIIKSGPKTQEDLYYGDNNYQSIDQTQKTMQNSEENKTNNDSASNLKNKSHNVSIETNYGTIIFETYDADAPNTVKNFITLAEKGFYDDVIFHRVIEGFMIQGGDPTGTGTGGPGYKFNDELNPNTESYKTGYKKGVVAMANAGPNTNGSQFFIMLEDNPLPNLYTIFGRVIKGQEVVDKIGGEPTGPGDKPLKDVIIKDVKVTKN